MFRLAADRRAGPRSPHQRRHRSSGQSLVEFSVVLPVLLALTGILIDASRIYQLWTTLEAGTRDAAQYLARSDTDPLAVDYTTQGVDSDTKAIRVLDAATDLSFNRSSTQGSLTDCSLPEVTTTYSQATTVASGGSTAHPASTAVVRTCVPFHTIFAYPFLTTDGTFVLRTERQITLIVGR